MSIFPQKWGPLRVAALTTGTLLMLYALFHLRVTTLPNPFDFTNAQTTYVWLSDITGALGLTLLLIRFKNSPVSLDHYTLWQLWVRIIGSFLTVTGIIIRVVLSPGLVHTGILQEVLISDIVFFGGFIIAFGPAQTIYLVKQAYCEVLLTSKEIIAGLGDYRDEILQSFIGNK